MGEEEEEEEEEKEKRIAVAFGDDLVVSENGRAVNQERETQITGSTQVSTQVSTQGAEYARGMRSCRCRQKGSIGRM